MELAYPVRPATEAVTMKKYRILIDAGHGGGQLGCTHEDFCEKEFNLDIATRLVKRLRSMGYVALPTRATDEFVTHDLRRAVANSLRPDLIVSIHADHNDDPRVAGMRVYYLSGDEDGENLAHNILVSDFTLNCRVPSYVLHDRVRVAGFNGTAAHPAPHWTGRAYNVLKSFDGFGPILVECGFSTNQEDREFMQSDCGRNMIVKAILEGIFKHA